MGPVPWCTWSTCLRSDRRAVKRLSPIAAAFVLLAFFACGDDSSTDATQPASKSTAERSEAGARVPSQPAPKRSRSSSAGVIAKRPEPKVRVPSGPPPKELVVENLIDGIGTVAKEGDELAVRYVGVDYKTRTEFENSWNLTLRFELGAGEVNEGWERGLEGMRVGGRRELIVPPDLAPSGRPDTLIYVVDLLAVK